MTQGRNERDMPGGRGVRRLTAEGLRTLVHEELRHLSEVHGNVQSEPEFGTLLDAFHALEDKGFSVDEITSAMAEYAHGTKKRGA